MADSSRWQFIRPVLSHRCENIGVKAWPRIVNEIEALAASTDFSIRQIQKNIASGDPKHAPASQPSAL
jgi:hypothetical protein